MSPKSKSKEELLLEIKELQIRLSEAEDTLEAIRSGAVDALVVSDEKGERIFTLQSVDYSYRVLVENMNEGAVTLNTDGIIIFGNKAFASMTGREMPKLVGTDFREFLPESTHMDFSFFLRDCTRIYAHRDMMLISNDKSLPVSFSGTCFESNGQTNVCLIISDLRERKEAERTLRQSEEHYRSLIENMTNSVALWEILKDETGKPYDVRYLEVNPAFEEAFGVKRENVIGHTLTEVFPAMVSNLGPDWIDEIAKKTQEGKPFTAVQTFEQQGKTYLTHTYFPGPDKCAVIRDDITEKILAEQALKESQKRYHDLFHNLAIPSYLLELITDDAGNGINLRFLEVNHVFEEFMNQSSSEMVGKRITDVIPGYFENPNFKKLIEVALSGKSYHNEMISAVNGRMVDVTMYSPIPKQVAVIFTDITERKKAEAEVKKLNEELEQRVRDRTSQLEFINRELEAFSYSISHDLRAPLRAIKNFADLFRDDFSSSLNEQGQDYIRRIIKNAEKMGGLIDDILNLSRISRQEFTPKHIDLSFLADLAIEELRQAEPQRKIEIVIARDLKVRADERMMKIALSNLLSNAWKYSAKNSDARVEFGIINVNGMNIFFVRDNGVGFDMNLSGKLFIPFQRLHSDNEFPGTGIGLAIVNRVIQRHGGRIWAESEIGRGAVFYFSLP